MTTPDVLTLTVDGIAVQEDQSAVDAVPFIPFNKRPSFAWTAHDADDDPMTYTLELIWDGARDEDGNPTIVAVPELTKTSLAVTLYTLRPDEALTYAGISNAGGDYKVVLTASDGTNTTSKTGWFRINHAPTMPIGLRII